MKKAFGYLRVSGKGQLDGDGFPRQREAIERYAAAHGITITQGFEEKGVCGATELDNRPALQELVAALHSSGTRLVLIEKEHWAGQVIFPNLSSLRWAISACRPNRVYSALYR